MPVPECFDGAFLRVGRVIALTTTALVMVLLLPFFGAMLLLTIVTAPRTKYPHIS
jgi:hypothetical protein